MAGQAKVTSVAMGCASSQAAAGLRRRSSCRDFSSASAVPSLYGSRRWQARSRLKAARATRGVAFCLPALCAGQPCSVQSCKALCLFPQKPLCSAFLMSEPGQHVSDFSLGDIVMKTMHRDCFT